VGKIRKYIKDRKAFFFQKHKKKTWSSLIVLTSLFWFCLPSPLFNDPNSMVLEDSQGNLLCARIAKDGQWRFPHNDTIPNKFSKAIVAFEDHYFYRHLGVNPFAFARAIGQNIKNRRVVSGGSTLTMQVIRMARKKKSRNIFNKSIEAIMATRLELTHSKKKIIAYYASNAPFGGNVVGLEAASWRYFGKSPRLLSWGEAATLAVLPNSPALIHLGRNREALLSKRNRLLDRMFRLGMIDKTACELAKTEGLPNQPMALPQIAPHLLDRAFVEQVIKQSKPSRVRTTIDGNLQAQLNRVVLMHHEVLMGNGIHNLAAVVVEVETGNIVAYCGNVPEAGKDFGADVDILRANRSTGSVLKPFLYAYAQQEGEILPNSLLLDVPTDLGNYHPENYHETYDGVIPARKALARSLNIPFVRLLNQYGIERFSLNLKKIGLTTITKSPEHYGLTIILGGAEGNLLEITNAYACMARTVKHFYPYSSRYDSYDWRPSNYLFANKPYKALDAALVKQAPIMNAASAWLALDAMKEVERPDAEGNWEQFQSNKLVAWKTGTSFGFRDAWACGVSPKYAVGVWAGNANGEGRPGLIGIEAAAPVLFDIFNLLNSPDWFEQPFDDMEKLLVCKQSGYRATEWCESDTVWTAKGGEKVKGCLYHQLVHLDKTRLWQVNTDCEPAQIIQNIPWFVLPPLEEYYYRARNATYTPPPPFRKDCEHTDSKNNPMQFIYPKNIAHIYVPIDFDGKSSSVVFRAAHSNPQTQIYWHLDDAFIATTKTFHELALTPTAGMHKITLVDEKGNRLAQSFEIVGKKK
jgi:penicillin-binding protein 1C